ncbi:MAG: hypothetical protein ACXACP_09965 [Candidatus Hodarchaeales archaeon]|jgi:hypothetical protein
MDRDEILQWINVYDQETNPSNESIEQEIRQRFQSHRYATKQDLLQVIGWKYSGRLRGRRRRILTLIEDCDAEYIRDLSAVIFKYDDDETRLTLLKTIKGIGNILSSIILTFYDPQNYAS